MGSCCSRASPDRPSESTHSDNVDPTMKSLVCDACWNSIFSTDAWQAVLASKEVPGRTGSSKGFTYTTTWAAIQTAADRDGCSWCRLVHPLLAAAKPAGESEVVIRAACDSEDSGCTPAGGKMLMVTGEGSGTLWNRRYHMYTSTGDKAARFVKARDRITDLSSPESYRLALECIENCVRTHYGKCPPLETGARLPDRVLDCSDVRKPKIVLTDGNQRGSYLALSYVWGGPQPMTTTENIDDHVNQGIDILKFPQTIQDAVLVTHSIGQRYLWIDALCIIQDSDEDKNRQLGKMREIYRNTYLAINVACARSSQEGFLQRHRPQKVANARIPYRCPDGSVGSVWIAEDMDTTVADGSHSYWDELDPINHRGWCLQEKLLPSRSLVYASDTLKYFCQTEVVNIGHALCEPSTVMRLPSVIYHPPASSDTALSEADQVVYRQAWLSVIFTYTLRDISVSSDKLPAVSGVAEQFHLVYKDQYLAGLWRKTLLSDLLWKKEWDIRPRPASYRAPTWSWASVDGLVSIRYKEFDLDDIRFHKADILGCQVSLASEEAPFGEVTGGILTLKGLMKQVILENAHVLFTNSSQESIKIGYATFDCEEERIGSAYVVPLVWDPLGPLSAGLVVVPTAQDQSRYTRVGKFNNDHELKDNSWLDGLSKREIILA